MEHDRGDVKDSTIYPRGTMVRHSDDPPPSATVSDHYWYIMNRWAEWSMAYARFFGFL